MKRFRFSLAVLFLFNALAFQAHLPGLGLPIPLNPSFVNTTALSPNPYLPGAQALPLARYYAGLKQKKTVCSQPLKLRFQLGKYLLLNFSYN